MTNDYPRRMAESAITHAFDNKLVLFGIVFTDKYVVNGYDRYDFIVIDESEARKLFREYLMQFFMFEVDFSRRCGWISV